MSSPEVDPDRLSLVSSLYGRGSIGCWLCTLASVFVSWTLNPESRRSDSVTNDLAAALAIPAVAAGHLFYQLYSPQYRALILGDKASSPRTIVLTSTIPTVIRYAVGVEAALSVCETFSNAALALFVIAALAGHVKRATCVLVIGLLAFSTEVAIFGQTYGVDVATSNLSRPFLFNFVEAMILILTFLGVSFIAIMILWLVGMEFGLRWTAPQQTTGARHETGRVVDTMSDEEIQDASTRIEARKRRWESFWSSVALGASGAGSFITLPFVLVGWVLSGTGVFGDTDYTAAETWISKLAFFMPRSSATITDLDQAVALAVGLVTLGFSIWDALKSRWRVASDETEIERRAKELQEIIRDQEIQRNPLTLVVELIDVVKQIRRGVHSAEERRQLIATRDRLRNEIAALGYDIEHPSIDWPL